MYGSKVPFLYICMVISTQTSTTAYGVQSYGKTVACARNHGTGGSVAQNGMQLFHRTHTHTDNTHIHADMCALLLRVKTIVLICTVF